MKYRGLHVRRLLFRTLSDVKGTKMRASHTIKSSKVHRVSSKERQLKNGRLEVTIKFVVTPPKERRA